VVIEEGVTVHHLIQEGDRVTGVQSTAGDHHAAHVVLTAGAWSDQLDDRLAQMMPVYPVRGQIVLLEMPKLPFRHVLDRGKCYLVPRLDGKIVVGATEEHKSGFIKANTADGISGLLNLAVRMVPALKEATMVKTWSGLRPGTPDHWPYIGPVPGFDGLIAATGHFRSGLTLAPATADVVVDWITTGKTDADLSRAKPDREIRKRK
jgi:glycine oxidase